MGLDGGTIPTRSDLLRRSSWRTLADDASRSTHGGNVTQIVSDASAVAQQKECKMSRWSQCGLSGEPLRPPLMSCRMGRLFRKEAIIEYLCGAEKYASRKESLKKVFGHINSMKDVFEIFPKMNPELENMTVEARSFTQTRTSSSANFCAPFVCPISGATTNGTHVFVALASCGHVFEENAMKELKKAESASSSSSSGKSETCCSQCGVPYSENDVVYLNPEKPEHVKENEKKMKEFKKMLEDKKRKRTEKKEKKDKRARKEEEKEEKEEKTEKVGKEEKEQKKEESGKEKEKEDKK
eukprot:TRINITY_DN3040_c0_g1_i2.p1 TRINITY_DN3040_c0_g1~~TRINITY_DN3040_c0_g1_i2.p1  ORF type:complete len:297 (+),score=106.26 TRINITY_DN3040_c0_g1_i2:160-1050(+)